MSLRNCRWGCAGISRSPSPRGPPRCASGRRSSGPVPTRTPTTGRRAAVPRAELPVFLDCDTGVDDALALAYLIGSPEVALVGVAATGGNVAVEQVCRNNLDLVALCGAPDIPVSAGAERPLAGPLPTGSAHGAGGLGYAVVPPAHAVATDHDAATAWVRAAHHHPGRLVGVVTGPLTNLALALQQEPALPTLLRRLVVMGGAYGIPVYRGTK